MIRAALVLLLVGCTGEPFPEPTDETTQASYFVTCEDLCSECGDLRCPSETRYLCPRGGDGQGHSCPPPGYPKRVYACVCCAANECRVGTPQDGFCQACPSGEICNDLTNQCCRPDTASEACGTRVCGTVSNGCGGTINCGTCSSGKSCVGGECCRTVCPVLRPGMACGAISNGCGGTITCTNCPANSTCTGGTCQCRAGYKNCGDSCVRSDLSCP